MANYVKNPPAEVESPLIPYDLETYNYFKRYLFQQVISVFKWTFPETWGGDQIRHFLYTLYTHGFIGIYDLPEYGVVALESGGGMGQNLFYAPKELILTNPALNLKGENFVIGETCVCMRLMPDVLTYGPQLMVAEPIGVLDIIEHFAESMALATQALNMDLINSQLAYVFCAKDKNVAESMKKLYAQMISGQPAVFANEGLYGEQGEKLWDAFQQNLRQNYIANDIITTLESLNDRFCSKVGIPNSNTRKESGISETETNANNIETQILSDIWLDTLKEGCKEVEQLFGVHIGVEKRYENIDERGEVNDVRNDRHSDNV